MRRKKKNKVEKRNKKGKMSPLIWKAGSAAGGARLLICTPYLKTQSVVEPLVRASILIAAKQTKANGRERETPRAYDKAPAQAGEEDLLLFLLANLSSIVLNITVAHQYCPSVYQAYRRQRAWPLAMLLSTSLPEVQTMHAAIKLCLPCSFCKCTDHLP